MPLPFCRFGGGVSAQRLLNAAAHIAGNQDERTSLNLLKLGVADLEAARSFYEAGARAMPDLSVNWEPASSLRPHRGLGLLASRISLQLDEDRARRYRAAML